MRVGKYICRFCNDANDAEMCERFGHSQNDGWTANYLSHGFHRMSLYPDLQRTLDFFWQGIEEDDLWPVSIVSPYGDIFLMQSEILDLIRW